MSTLIQYARNPFSMMKTNFTDLSRSSCRVSRTRGFPTTILLFWTTRCMKPVSRTVKAITHSYPYEQPVDQMSRAALYSCTISCHSHACTASVFYKLRHQRPALTFGINADSAKNSVLRKEKMNKRNGLHLNGAETNINKCGKRNQKCFKSMLQLQENVLVETR